MKAFPVAMMEGHEDDLGMDLRDYFAGKAMMIAIRLFNDQSSEIPYIDDTGEPMDYEEGSSGVWFPHTKEFGQTCYAIADVMMEARKK